jgi:truncated hemoglobin YjbI
MTDEPTLFEAAGGMPFFEALVARFYAAVGTDRSSARSIRSRTSPAPSIA